MVNTDWSIEVNTRRCVGSGLCAAGAPDYFTLAGNRSQPVNFVVKPDEAVIDAAEGCPMEAITVRDAADSKVIAPSP